ncbi:uncharacterized protein LOC131670176 [Phymastichus coffea]|uniref:uncharacterized protein LOC131670176 n=1 Tax=Phymastichus coffea TaxID=108790 RepID=UPI00273AE6DD|nr:uncharacterized protein LOC131670176 [Phymastichus coffea]
MTLLEKPIDTQVNCVEIVNETVEEFDTDDVIIVFFDLETAGLRFKHEILQICVKAGQQVFKSYITPTQPIHPEASKTNGLTKVHKKLFRYGVEVPTLPKRIVFGKLLEFLKSLKKKSLFVAHNCPFDSSRLILCLQSLSLLESYEEVIDGFSDSLFLFKQKYPKRESEYKLTTLGTELLSLPTEGAHDACFDVNLLEKLTRACLPINDIINIKKSVGDVVATLTSHENEQKLLPSFAPMAGVISDGMQKRLSSAGISYQTIVDTITGF